MSQSPEPIDPPRRARRASRATRRSIAEQFRGMRPTGGIRVPVPGWLRRFGAWLATLGRVVALATRSVWGVLRGPLSILSAIGWLVLLAAAASLTTGLLLGWQEFVYLGLTLVAGLLVAVAFVFGRASFSVVIELTPRRVVAGDRALGRLGVTNSGTRRSAPTRLELPVGAGVAEFVVPALQPGQEHDELFAVPTQRRAVIVAGPAVSVRGDQLGLLRRTLRWTDPVELFVHPQTVRLQPSAAGLVKDLEGEPTKTIVNNDISFHALRPYEPGDDRRYVHWRTSARTGQLMVRQFEETRRSQLTMMLTTDRRHYATDEEFELAVSIAASIGVRTITDGTGIAVVSERIALRTSTTMALLDDSCRLELGASEFASTRDFARVSTLRLPPPSVAVLITGSLTPLADFRSVERLFGLDTQTIGFRAAAGEQPAISVIKGLRVATIGALGELRGMVRRTR